MSIKNSFIKNQGYNSTLKTFEHLKFSVEGGLRYYKYKQNYNSFVFYASNIKA